MTTYEQVLKPGELAFVKEIMDQLPAGMAQQAFPVILNKLASYKTPEDIKSLEKLEALEQAGVDNWEWYDDAMAMLRDDDEDDDA